jgi:hypothetical protein
MKMNTVLKTLLVALLLAIATPALPHTPVPHPTETPEEHAQRLQNRLEEIKAIDKGQLSKEEKKALRKEVKEIKKEIKAISGGVYLSVGAIILIVLLIILLA